MINAVVKRPIGQIEVPGATLGAELVADESGRVEVWIFVHPEGGRRSSTLLHLDKAAWMRFYGLVCAIHRLVEDPSEKRLAPEESRRGAYR
ncbi:MAG: hypothetical protein WC563_16100 [Brevundimonas sp.]